MESSIAAFLWRQSACELLPTTEPSRRETDPFLNYFSFVCERRRRNMRDQDDCLCEQNAKLSDTKSKFAASSI